MKKYLNYFFLASLLILTLSITYLRFNGARPTQFSQTFIILILILNVIWILWNTLKGFGVKQTRTDKN